MKKSHSKKFTKKTHLTKKLLSLGVGLLLTLTAGYFWYTNYASPASINVTAPSVAICQGNKKCIDTYNTSVTQKVSIAEAEKIVKKKAEKEDEEEQSPTVPVTQPTTGVAICQGDPKCIAIYNTSVSQNITIAEAEKVVKQKEKEAESSTPTKDTCSTNGTPISVGSWVSTGVGLNDDGSSCDGTACPQRQCVKCTGGPKEYEGSMTCQSALSQGLPVVLPQSAGKEYTGLDKSVSTCFTKKNDIWIQIAIGQENDNNVCTPDGQMTEKAKVAEQMTPYCNSLKSGQEFRDGRCQDPVKKETPATPVTPPTKPVICGINFVSDNKGGCKTTLSNSDLVAAKARCEVSNNKDSNKLNDKIFDSATGLCSPINVATTICKAGWNSAGTGYIECNGTQIHYLACNKTTQKIVNGECIAISSALIPPIRVASVLLCPLGTTPKEVVGANGHLWDCINPQDVVTPSSTGTSFSGLTSRTVSSCSLCKASVGEVCKQGPNGSVCVNEKLITPTWDIRFPESGEPGSIVKDPALCEVASVPAPGSPGQYRCITNLEKERFAKQNEAIVDFFVKTPGEPGSIVKDPTTCTVGSIKSTVILGQYQCLSEAGVEQQKQVNNFFEKVSSFLFKKPGEPGSIVKDPALCTVGSIKSVTTLGQYQCLSEEQKATNDKINKAIVDFFVKTPGEPGSIVKDPTTCTVGSIKSTVILGQYQCLSEAGVEQVKQVDNFIQKTINAIIKKPGEPGSVVEDPTICTVGSIKSTTQIGKYQCLNQDQVDLNDKINKKIEEILATPEIRSVNSCEECTTGEGCVIAGLSTYQCVSTPK